MQQTQNYNLLIVEGTDVVNPLTQVNPNFQSIDGAMFANKQATIGTASEVVTGTVHAIIRNNADSDVFRFTATGPWTAGDTMTLDGQAVTVHLSDGTTPATNSYIIGAEVLAMVNGSLVTLAISSTPPARGVTSFNSRTGAVVPRASDYEASMIDYDNTLSGLTATDVQSAIDEVSSYGNHGIVELWKNSDITASFASQTVIINDFDSNKIDAIIIVTEAKVNEQFGSVYVEFDKDVLTIPGYNGLIRLMDMYGVALSMLNRSVAFSLVLNTLSISFGDCNMTYYPTYSNATNVTDNERCVPVRILGLIHNN